MATVSLSISITQNGQAIAANTSNVTVKVVASWTYGAYNHNQKPGWVKIDGVKYNFTSNFNTGETKSGNKTIFTKTLDVAHGDTGAKTLAVSASYTTGVSAGTIMASTSKTLDTIHRATTPTVSAASADMGDTVTISTPGASEDFTHDLAYSFGGSDFVAIATDVVASCDWVTPDLAGEVPNAVNGAATIRCITKYGGVTVGTKTVTMTLKVPDSVVPSITGVVRHDVNTAVLAQFGAYIKTKSQIKTSISATGAKGSTIKSYSATFEGKRYTGAEFTTDTVATSGTLDMVVTVTDSRGRTASTTLSTTVLDYSRPTISALTAYRVDASGAEDPDGDHIAVRYVYGVASLGIKNTAAMVIEFKLSTDTEWTQLLTSSVRVGKGTATPASPTFSTDYQYNVRMTVTDWFGTAISRSTILPSGTVVLDIGADGDCLGIGETAQEPGTVGSAWILKVKHGEIPRNAVVIPAGADLDTYTTPGYYVFSSEAVATISSLPFATCSGSLEVYSEGDEGQLRQVVTRCSESTREIWERLYYSGAWHSWAAVYKGGTGRILWSGVQWMLAAHTATLSEKVSEQPNGIILVFSQYTDGAADNSSFRHRVISKDWVALFPGHAECVQLTTSDLSLFATKYLYIHDDKIVGHDNNTKSGTGASGITYTNSRFVLRYVIGF